MDTPQETPPNQPGIKTSEFAVAGAAGFAALVPVIKALIDKSGDTTVEIVCLTVVACVYIVCRTYLKTK